MSADAPRQAATPASFLAAQAALQAIDQAVRTARGPQPATRPQSAGRPASARPASGRPAPEQPPPDHVDAEQALAALLLLRELRDQLAGWETGLIETAREAGASWADLAAPLGVASRQAAERRYLRLRPGTPGSTGEQRVRATRDRRAADRAVTTWARGNAADLRQLAGQITALADLPDQARAALSQALAHHDAASLVTPLASVRDCLAAHHPDLAARVDGLTHHTDRLRRERGDQRRPT